MVEPDGQDHVDVAARSFHWNDLDAGGIDDVVDEERGQNGAAAAEDILLSLPLTFC